jgi:serine/threonine protein kinase
MEVPGYKLGSHYEREQYYQSYSALNLNNHKTVNIQFFNPALVTNQAFRSQFKRITKMLAGRKIGVMSSVLHAEVSDHACYLITEHYFCPQQISSNTLNLTRHEVLQFAVQIAQTLDKLHKLKLVHGGIELNSLCFKSRDILVLKPPMLHRVINILRPMTFKSLTKAQKQYLAPEANKGLSPATDFYALGILIYQLLFGLESGVANDFSSKQNHILNSEHNDLEYFFRRLLTEDVGQRIKNIVQFKAALHQCGVGLSDTPEFSNKAIFPHQLRFESVETASRSNIKWIVPTVGLTVVTLAGALFFLPLEEMQRQFRLPNLKNNIVSETTKSEKETDKQTPALVSSEAKSEPQVTTAGFNKLYQQALAKIETNPKMALLIIKVALKNRPQNADAIHLKNRIEKHIEIDTILEVAESQLKEGQLISPKGNNAYESYQALAKVLSPDDERVRTGLTKIAEAYHTLSENELENNQLEKALEYVDTGLSVKADYSQLLVLRSNIIEKQALLEHESQVEQRYQELLLRNQKYTDALIHTQLRQIKQIEQSASDKAD